MSPNSLSVNLMYPDGNAVVVVAGELDLDSAPRLSRELESLIESGPPEVVIDFSDLSFVDSSGLAVLVSAQKRLVQQERHLAIRGARPAALRLFEITGLTDLLHVEAGGSAPPGPELG